MAHQSRKIRTCKEKKTTLISAQIFEYRSSLKNAFVKLLINPTLPFGHYTKKPQPLKPVGKSKPQKNEPINFVELPQGFPSAPVD